MQIYLYSTLGCHLCEQAKSVLWPLLLQYHYELVEVDIATNDELIERYGIRIPVLSTVDNSDELNWPFDAAAVEKLFAKLHQV